MCLSGRVSWVWKAVVLLVISGSPRKSCTIFYYDLEYNWLSLPLLLLLPVVAATSVCRYTCHTHKHTHSDCVPHSTCWHLAGGGWQRFPFALLHLYLAWSAFQFHFCSGQFVGCFITSPPALWNINWPFFCVPCSDIKFKVRPPNSSASGTTWQLDIQQRHPREL